MPNSALAARILRRITERPDTHDQSRWLGGTDLLHPTDDITRNTTGTRITLCVAAFAAHLTGYTLEHGPDLTLAYKAGHPAVLVDDVSRNELALTASDAAWLFETARTRAEVTAALAQLAAGAPGIDRASVHDAARTRTEVTAALQQLATGAETIDRASADETAPA